MARTYRVVSMTPPVDLGAIDAMSKAIKDDELATWARGATPGSTHLLANGQHLVVCEGEFQAQDGAAYSINIRQLLGLDSVAR